MKSIILKKYKDMGNPAYMNPLDLKGLGLEPGELVEISSERSSIYAVVQAGDDVRSGSISMAHAWGDAPSEDDRVREIGASTGRLSDTTRGFDPITGIPLMSAIPVNIKRVP